MRCPKCQFDHELQTTECLKCGIVFSRYQAAVEEAAKVGEIEAQMGGTARQSTPETDDADAAIARDEASRELKYRIFALPIALLAARLVAGTGLRLAAAMLAMVLHESGHAITAWLTGRWAVPLLWVTPHGQERSWAIVALVTGAILIGGYVAWRMERWGWVMVAAAALVVQMVALSLPGGAAIVFFGDGGAMVLATLLMAAFYAPKESAVARSWGLRWGLLVIGALSFAHVFLIWTGPIENLPFGEIEGVNLSDPSLLTEMYGWTALQMVDRYVRLGTICLAALGAVYVWGLVSAYLQMRSSAAAGG